jgi:hypothetical protein
MAQRDLALVRQPLGEVRRHREAQRLGGAIGESLPRRPATAPGLEEPEHARLGLDELACRVDDPAQDLVEVLGGDERLGQVVQHGQAVLLVGQTALRQHVLDRRRQLGQIAVALDQIIRDSPA